MFTDEYFMKIALAEAEAAFVLGEIPVGALIVSGHKIIAKGRNSTEALVDVTAHAEMLAITAAAEAIGGKYLRNCTLYVTLEPCIMCAGALYWSQISKVVIGAADEKRGYRNAGVQLHPKTEVTSGIFEKECGEIVKEFFRLRRI